WTCWAARHRPRRTRCAARSRATSAAAARTRASSARCCARPARPRRRAMSEANGNAGRAGTDGAASVDTLEPDRYELAEPPRYRFALSRRRFLGTVGAGVVVLVGVRDGLSLEEQPTGEPVLAQADAIGAWLHIGEDGAVTVFTGKVEVGQDIRTSLTQAVAEELGVPPLRITLVMGDTDRVPYDAGTFGSRSTPQMGTQLRRAAAAARTTLLRLAAERWSADDASQHALGLGRASCRE